MLAGISLGTDLKRYTRGALPRIALTTIILLPLLYGAMYLWAFWNPFGELDKVPVALVNADRGTVVDGQPVRAGDQVAKALVDSNQLDLHQVSADQAARGVGDGTYYFSITLPANFSAAIASPAGESPQQAQIQFNFNDANNYLGSVIGQNTAREVLNQVNASVGRQTIGTVVSGISDAGAGLTKAADGADQLTDGLTTADDGAQRLATGSRDLAKGLTTARTRSASLASGSQQLAAGVAKATDPLLTVLDRLHGADFDPNAVANVASHLSSAAESTTDRIAALNVDQAQAAAIVDQVIGSLRTNPDPTVRDYGEVLAGAQRLLHNEGIDPATDDGLTRLRNDSAELRAQFADPNSSLRTLTTQALNGQLKSDIVTLRDGATRLKSGAQQLNTGLVSLADGGDRLADGAANLAEGTTTLKDGSQHLASSLRDGAAQVPSWNEHQQSDVAQTLAQPVGIDLHSTNHAATFGTGFAPFFMPLALFIGALIIWMLLTPLRSQPINAGAHPLRVVLASFWPALLIAVCQVVVMYVVVHFGVGLQANRPLATVAFLILVIAAFLAMIQAFNALFGVAVGRVVTLAFLMFQLVSSGGIYPVETTAKPFQVIHPFNPMTYAVTGLRQLIMGGVDSRLWVSIAVLGGVLVVSIAASSWAARRNRQYTMERLHPPIEV